MTHFIAAVFGWLRRRRTPPKPDGQPARPTAPTRPRPSRRANPKPQTHPQWRTFVPPAPSPATDDGPPVQDSATVVPPYLMTPREVAERRRRIAEAGQAHLAAAVPDANPRPAAHRRPRPARGAGATA
ncbi:hypothetical protein OG948_31345 [Embleya sp. NBC_00888]|uniref:hypothetical protein n=1 Tax=Embleya sp. NBC_00888 TaxID=2975960 RepID=UPI003867E887|nr:hypothetical protein OG948_31345 [Embleya sp. NBC_00888]